MKMKSLLYSGVLTLGTLLACAAMRPTVIPDPQPRGSQTGVVSTLDAELADALRDAARQGNVAAQLLFGQILAAQRSPDKLPEAIGWLTEAAKAGEAKADLALGKLYLMGGPGFPPAPAQAEQHLQSAARRGEGRAAYYLALMYKNGIGVERDSKAAARWLTVAADKQVRAAMITLADMYSIGEGLIADAAQAHRWLEQAAQSEPPEASRMLALGLHGESMQFSSDGSIASSEPGN